MDVVVAGSLVVYCQADEHQAGARAEDGLWEVDRLVGGHDAVADLVGGSPEDAGGCLAGAQ